MGKHRILQDERRVIGTVKHGNRITGVIVPDLSPGTFQLAFDGLLHTPIIVKALPVEFDLFQEIPEVEYVEPE